MNERSGVVTIICRGVILRGIVAHDALGRDGAMVQETSVGSSQEGAKGEHLVTKPYIVIIAINSNKFYNNNKKEILLW